MDAGTINHEQTPIIEGPEFLVAKIALGACRGVDPNLFFPERGEDTSEAKRICGRCVLEVACLEYALVNGEKFGIWGGLSERQRRPLRSRMSQGVRRTG